MKQIKFSALLVGIAFLSSYSYAQKAKETSAAVEYQKVQKSMMMQDMDGAKKALLSAKSYIDEAVQHEDTKNSQKTLWLQGDIYGTLAIFKAQDTTIDVDPEKAIDISIESYTKGYPLGKKYQRDIQESANRAADMMFMAGGMAYEKEMFEEAGEAYELAARYRGSVDVFDSTSIFNSALCYEKSEKYEKAAMHYEKLATVGYKGIASAVDASRAYRNAGNLEKAMAIINEARKKDPSNRELLLELVNANIEAGDAPGAEKALNDAISTDPNNKQLHYTIGTIYIDLKENEKAETALRKALEIDPNYQDAQYQLGAHLVTWAGDLKLQADGLKFGDPNYNKLKQQSDETYQRAVDPLEKYIESNPNDKAVLTILFHLHRNLGNSEKALEYKKRADAAE